MSTSEVKNPYQQFNDLNGLPLTGGYVYVGVAGQDPETNPIATFWDAAGTIATGVIRTSGGYIARTGSPAQVYVAPATYSMRIRNRLGVETFYLPNASDVIGQTLAALAGATGAGLIGYNYGTANSVTRTVAAKAKDRVSIQDWNAVGGDVGNDATRIQRAFDECPLGETLHFPPVAFAIGAPSTPGTAGLTLSRQINLAFSKTRLVGFFGSDTTSNLLNIKITQAVFGAGDVRRTKIEGLESYFATGGNDVLYIENASPMASNLQMHFTGCGFGGNATNGVAVHIKGVVTQLHEFFDCAIDNQVFLDGCADSCNFVHNTMGGIRAAFRVRLASGAFRTLIAHNTIVARDGAMVIENGSQVDFLYNQCEQSGTNLGPYSAFIALDASDSSTPLQIKRVNIIGNNFGGGALQTAILASTGGNGLGITDVFCDLNTFGTTTLADLRLLDTGVDAFRWGDNNYCRGSRGGVTITDPPGSASTNALDQTDLFVINDNGQATYGVWQPPTKLTFANGWASDNTRFRKALDDRLMWEGSFAAGTLTTGTTICTLPVGFRPKFDLYLSVPTNVGPGTIRVQPSGVISTLNIPGGANTISMGGESFRVQGRVSYNPGV